MIPFYKIGSLIMRIFSKPIVNFAKRYSTITAGDSAFPNVYIRRFFIFIGNKYHLVEV